MKKLLTILFFVVIFAPCAAADMVLQGGAEYNVQSAREEIADEVQYKINPVIFSANLIDPNCEENLTALYKGQVSLKDRELALFSVGTYGVTYKNDPLHAYYYSNRGILEYIDIRSRAEYPYKSYQYDIAGNLVNMGLRISKREAYIYDSRGRLIAHWVGSNGYDENGKIVMTRRFIE